MRHLPEHRSIVVVDIAEFGRRDNRFQLWLREALSTVVRYAADSAGMPWDELAVEDRGDSKILVVPATVSKVDIVDGFVRHLVDALRHHNDRSSDPARMRMRMAAHAGEVHRDAEGWAGADLNLACRLVDSAAAHRALHRAPDADLVVLVSSPMYDAVVRHGYGGIEPSRYHPVEVGEKEVRTTAWVHVPGLGRLPAPPTRDTPVPDTTEQRPREGNGAGGAPRAGGGVGGGGVGGGVGGGGGGGGGGDVSINHIGSVGQDVVGRDKHVWGAR
ncbi:hypothetical protein LX15_004618 [Streptoalloteichus tenebrarius]|uniref:Guanylate cyclase domain-containing protein n=1 Tax=Streptoalloteichus tenebrarius (strain ATCC 17920 / DSM 40477 / JCM 4838 / CBS 697.72 / NBRC 16177 / NCIMB 11028 / NRRL B-12390 / A12253. 1 / ISP 5477) TaxID=1933 RepID=A0ABT1HZE3_STRSD|nr:hypothetical protein [Streptoalloteichus tenebrarius]MCP2260898.1 hypothetical protein [Streptoalloteichus tenebrarius]BFF03341.1 hypothetical protein GCM10020241_50160 [Streptoalloteichus tenebrarius]